MIDLTLGRRDFIRLGILGGVFSLAGCSFTKPRPTLSLPRGILPIEALQALTKPWSFEFLDVHPGINLYQSQLQKKVDLIAIGDGWLKDCPFESFQAIGEKELYENLNGQAINFLNSFGSDFSEKLYPVLVSPWVLIFRGGESFLPKARESWEVLLDSRLRKKVILPTSPRLVMALAKRMRHNDSLRLLRSQARSYDDKNGLNWLLSGKAKVAVLPLQSCLNAIRQDPRLSIALPRDGCPLNWTLLLRPNFSVELFPSSWIKQTWELPLLVKLLVRGVIPPVLDSELIKAIDLLPDDYKLIYKSESLWERSWSLPPLTLLEEKSLEQQWLDSSP